MYVCVYVCVCMYVCRYVCCMYVRTFVGMYALLPACLCLFPFLHPSLHFCYGRSFAPPVATCSRYPSAERSPRSPRGRIGLVTGAEFAKVAQIPCGRPIGRPLRPYWGLPEYGRNGLVGSLNMAVSVREGISARPWGPKVVPKAPDIITR